MPNKPRTQHRSVRIADAEWEDLGAVTAKVGTDRAKIINQLVAWWLGRPGASLPSRPGALRAANGNGAQRGRGASKPPGASRQPRRNARSGGKDDEA